MRLALFVRGLGQIWIRLFALNAAGDGAADNERRQSGTRGALHPFVWIFEIPEGVGHDGSDIQWRGNEEENYSSVVRKVACHSPSRSRTTSTCHGRQQTGQSSTYLSAAAPALVNVDLDLFAAIGADPGKDSISSNCICGYASRMGNVLRRFQVYHFRAIGNSRREARVLFQNTIYIL